MQTESDRLLFGNNKDLFVAMYMASGYSRAEAESAWQYQYGEPPTEDEEEAEPMVETGTGKIYMCKDNGDGTMECKAICKIQGSHWEQEGEPNKLVALQPQQYELTCTLEVNADGLAQLLKEELPTETLDEFAWREARFDTVMRIATEYGVNPSYVGQMVSNWLAKGATLEECLEIAVGWWGNCSLESRPVHELVMGLKEHCDHCADGLYLYHKELCRMGWGYTPKLTKPRQHNPQPYWYRVRSFCVRKGYH